MSEQGDLTLPMAYDPVELRLRIAVCFSVPELRTLAESLGVSGSIAWDRGTQEAVRELVRQFERYYGLPTLVAKLRELRPLVEWPEAQPIEPSLSPFAGGAPPLSSPGALGVSSRAAEPPPDEPPLQDPRLPPESAAPRAFAPAPPPGREAPGWPGIAPPEAAPSRAKSLDPRLLFALLAFVALAAVIAFAAGRAGAPAPALVPASAAADSAAQKSPRAAPSMRPDGPATRAAAALARALATIARDCEVSARTPNTAEILTRANEQCGPAKLLPRAGFIALPGAAPPPAAAPAEPDVKPERVRAPKRGDAAAKDPPKVPGGGCIHACDASRAACNAQCGSEPTQSSKYEAYQLCRSRCLAEQSRCRLGCR